MYNFCKSICISTYIFTFYFYINDGALTVEFLFKNLNPGQRIPLEFNTSSFLLPYIERAIDWWKMWSKKKEISICRYILSFRVFADENKHISNEFIAKSVEHRQRISLRFTSMIFNKRKLLWIFSHNLSKVVKEILFFLSDKMKKQCYSSQPVSRTNFQLTNVPTQAK